MHRLGPPLLTMLVLAQPAAAVESTLTPAGFTGLGITPNAHLLDWGRLGAAYDSSLPGVTFNPKGHNYVLGFGLLPNLEFAGRLATNDLESNCFFDGCGARDLSASGKVAIGLDTANRWRLAAGATDVGGAVTYFRTFYGVITYNEGPFEVSAGLARRTGAGISGSRSALDGPFAAAAWQPHPVIRGHVEYADGNAWAGVRVFAPKEWLPEGWSLSAGANAQLNRNNLTSRNWWSASVSIPLYKVPELPTKAERAALPVLAPGQLPLPAYEARNLPPPPEPTAAPKAADGLQALADALHAQGLDDISIGRMPDETLAIRANNAAYRWNTVDALGAALGAISRTLGDGKTGYRLVLTERNIPVVAVTGQADCLRDWIANKESGCPAGQLSTPGTTPLDLLHAGANWVIRRHSPGWQRLRLGASPVLRTNQGTEFGAFDYALGASVSAQLPLWAGASIDYAHTIPLANTSDYGPAGVFASRRIRNATERLALTQTVRLPVERWILPGDDVQARRWGLGAVTAQATVGRVGTFYDGIHGAVRWEPGEGHHRLTFQAGVFDNNEFNGGLGPLRNLRTAKPLLASYRYRFMPTRTDLEGTAGQFMRNDRGFQVGLRQWFTDTSVSLYYKRTQFPGEPVRQRVGVELTVPFGPRRDWQPLPNLQVGGTPRFGHFFETTVGEQGLNPIFVGHAELPPVISLDTTFNSDRAGLNYFEDNVRRLRDTAR